MHSPTARASRRLPPRGWLILPAACLTLWGCSTPRRQRAREAWAAEPAIELTATGAFFNGALVADATLSNRITREHRPADDESGGAMSSGGSGGSRGHHWGGGSGGSNWRGHSEDSGGDGDSRPMMRTGAGGRPLILRLQFSNHGNQNLDLTILDIDSELGDFEPQPDHLLLAPGQSGELQPMISRLGVVAAQIPLKLSVQQGKQREEQTLVLQVAAPPPAPAATAAPHP